MAERVARYYVDKFKSVKPAERQHISVKVMDDRIAIMVKSAGVASETDEGSYDAVSEFTKEEQQQIATVMEDGDALAELEDKEKPDGKEKFRPVFLSRNAISLSQDVQLVIRFYGEPDQIHETYDFVHACCFWTSWDKKLTLRQEALEAMLAKELRYRGSKYPLCSLFRMKKFIERGWHVNCGTILKICWNLQEFDLGDIAVLEEMLTGVDLAFFVQVIEALRQRNKETNAPDQERVDGLYLMELINKIF